ncbi:MAG: hypothetical protein GXO87_04880, partial [Chlorobi bacterium]|nr:hypothetical protein [Chlorobiota bacterium]
TSTILIIAFLFLIGVIQISPPEKLAGGPWLIDENHFIIYLERIPGLIGGFNHHFIRGYYYIPTPLEMLFITLFTGVIFATYDPRYIERLKNLFKKKY